MKHTIGDLKQMQSLPLRAKVLMTKQRIKAWYEHWDGDVYLAFSGGKDSTVLKHIIDSMYDDVPAVFVNTGLEFPELRTLAMRQKNVVRVDPKMKFYDVINTYGYPVISKEIANCIDGAKRALSKDPNSNAIRVQRIRGTLKAKDGVSPSQFNCQKYEYLMDAPFKVSDKCCTYMKKEPLKRYEKETGRKPIVGTMTHEGRARLNSWLKTGCNSFDSKAPMSKPMSFWTEQDILQYIVENDLEIASVYGEIIVNESGQYELTGEPRTGCMFCMFGCHLEKEPNRFQRMKQTHPKQHEYCMNKLGLKEVLDYIGVDYE